jgi:cysteine dioxygenase
MASVHAPPPAGRCPPRDGFPKLAGLIDYLDGLRARADLDVLSRLLQQATVTRADLLPACTFGTSGYRRNTISEGPWYELLCLCWRSGHVTPIHDHRGVSCAFKVIEGTGTEVRFEVTASGLVCPSGTADMAPGYICAAQDEAIHQVANMQAPGQDLITLHIYSPPIAKMHTYTFATSNGAEECQKYT